MRRHELTNPAAAHTDGASHDHAVCIDALLDRAKHSFGEKGLKLTALRLRVLEEIAASHDAVGAYDVLERLAARSGGKVAPISVYRAIEALREAGVVHRLESRNAFFACHAPHLGRHGHMALVCDKCAEVVEVEAPDFHASLQRAGRDRGFAVTSAIAEGFGVCEVCRAEATKPAHEEQS